METVSENLYHLTNFCQCPVSTRSLPGSTPYLKYLTHAHNPQAPEQYLGLLTVVKMAVEIVSKQKTRFYLLFIYLFIFVANARTGMKKRLRRTINRKMYLTL